MSKDTKELLSSLITAFFTLVIGAIVIIYFAFSWGFVLFKLWGWFILPVFPMLPFITLWQAVGLSMFVDLFKNHTSHTYKEDPDRKNSATINGIISPWLMLLLAWFVKWFILNFCL